MFKASLIPRLTNEPGNEAHWLHTAGIPGVVQYARRLQMLGCGVICFMISSSLQRVSISLCIASSATKRRVRILTRNHKTSKDANTQPKDK